MGLSKIHKKLNHLIIKYSKYKEFGISFTLTIATRLITLFFGLLLSRWQISRLSENELYEYSFIADSFNIFILGVISFGIPVLIHKYYTNSYGLKSEKEINKFWSTLFYFRIFSYFFGLILIFGIFFTLISFTDFLPNNLPAFVLIYTAQFILVFDQSYRSVADALNKSWLFGFTDLISKFSIVVVIYTLSSIFKFENNLFFLIGTLNIIYILTLITDFLIYQKYTKLVKPDYSIILKNIKPLLFITATAIFGFFYLFSMQITMSILSLPTKNVNTFSIAYNKIFLTISTIIGVVSPNISSRIKKRLQHKKDHKIWRILVFIIGLSFLLFVLSNIVATLIYSILDKNLLYPESIPLFRLISIAFIFYPLIYILGDLIVFHDKEKYQFITAIVLGFLGFTMQIVMGSWIGLYGIAIAFVINTILDLLIKLLLFYLILKSKK